MRSSAAGMAGMICIPSNNTTKDPNKQAERKLVYRTLGKTGISVPVIGMGILSSGSPALIRAAIDAGITHFDSTAARSQQKKNEKMIGEIMKGRPRDSFIYGSKIHLPQNNETGLYKKEATEEVFTSLLDKALRNLQLDYVDIVYHHMVSRKQSMQRSTRIFMMLSWHLTIPGRKTSQKSEMPLPGLRPLSQKLPCRAPGTRSDEGLYVYLWLPSGLPGPMPS